MRGKRGAIRAALFLLFAVALVLAAPWQTPVNTGATFRAPAEHHEEHRESMKLRERLPGVEQQRNPHARHLAVRRVEPSVSRRDVVTADWSTGAQAAAARSAMRHRQELVRKRHSPPLLQVFRH